MSGIQSILIPAPEAEPVVESFRRSGDWSSDRIPAHLTIAGPWPLATRLPLRPLRELCSAMEGERYTLGTIGMLGDSVCLFPDDDRALLRWRDHILTVIGAGDDTDDDWRMHLTVGRSLSSRAMKEVEASIVPVLPLFCEVGGLLIAQRHVDSRITLQAL